MYIDSSEALQRAKAADWPVTEEGEHSVLEAPGGYKFFIANKPQPKDTGNHYSFLVSHIHAMFEYLSLYRTRFYIYIACSYSFQ